MRRIRTKLIGAFLIVVLVPLVGTGLYGNWITSQTLREQALESLQHDLDQRANRIQSDLAGIADNTRYLASLSSLQALLTSTKSRNPTRSQRVTQVGEDFRRFADAHPDIIQVRYIDQTGMELVRVNSVVGVAWAVRDDQLQDKSDRYYFRQTESLEPGEIFVSDLDLNWEYDHIVIPHQPVMRYATPVSFDDGTFAGAIVLNVDAREVLAQVQSGTGNTHTLALVNRDGFYLSHPNLSMLWGGPRDLDHGRQVGDEHFGFDVDNLTEPEGFINLSADPGSAWNPWTQTIAWLEDLILGPQRVLGYYTVFPAGESSDVTWVLLRDEPRTTIYASVWSFRVGAAGILAGAAFTASLVAVVLARGLTAPILTLTQSVRRLADGQPLGVVDVNAKDEMGELAGAFTEMAVALQHNLERLTFLNQGGQHIAGQMERHQVSEAILLGLQGLVDGDYHVVSLTQTSVADGTIDKTSGDEAWLTHRDSPEVMATLQDSLDGNTWRTIALPADTGPAGYLCCAPLCVGVERQGLVEVYGKSESLNDATAGSLVTALANQGAIALEKADLIQQLKDHQAQLEALVERLIHAQEEERRVVAYDIHDGLIQMLVGVRLQLTNFAASGGAAAPGGESGLKRGLDQLGTAISEARLVIEGLRPLGLDELGLVDSLRQYAEELAEDAGWQLAFDASPPDMRAPLVVETTAYRIAQEALTNARKYAGTNRVRVSLACGEDFLGIEVRDWGQGFDPGTVVAHSQSVGLAGIRERARLLRGRCTIDSRPGEGTTVKAVLPLRGEGTASG